MAVESELEDSFISRLERVEEAVKNKYNAVCHALETRKTDILSHLGQLKAKYKGEGVYEQIYELIRSRDHVNTSLRRNENEGVLKQSVAVFDTRIRELREEFERGKARMKSVVLEWNEEVEEMVSTLGAISVTDKAFEANQTLIKETSPVKGSEKEKVNPVYFNCEDRQLFLELRMELVQLKEKELEMKEAIDKSNEIIDYLHSEKKRLEDELRLIKGICRPSNDEIHPIPFQPPSQHPPPPKRSLSRQKSFQITCDERNIIVLPLSHFGGKGFQFIGNTGYCKPSGISPYIHGIIQCCFQDSETERVMAGVDLFVAVGDSNGVYKKVRYFNTGPKKAIFLPFEAVFVQKPSKNI